MKLTFISILALFISIQCTAQVPGNDPSNKIVFYEGGAFAIPIDTAYKYRELLKYYFNIGIPWEDAEVDRAVIDTSKPKVFYGIAGIKQSEPKDTLKRFYFHRYLYFLDRMNETTGKKSARMEDSANFYYKKLYKK